MKNEPMKNDKWQLAARVSDIYLSLFIVHLSFDRNLAPGREGFSG
jgi:hypothetical protein